MKFSDKVFFSVMAVVMLTFTIGGYVLVSALFSAAVSRESTSALDENKMLRFSLESVFSGIAETGSEISAASAKQLAQPVSEGLAGAQTTVFLLTEEGDVLFRSSPAGSVPAGFSSVISGLDSTARQYQIQSSGQSYYLETASILRVNHPQTLYLFTSRDISDVFSDRAAQFAILQRITVIMLLVAGTLVFALAKILTAPLAALSRTTRRIANGDLKNRARVSSGDEIGLLAADFNRMADGIELRIRQLEEANLRQETFIANFAHELKTPLTSMIGYADMLRSRRLSEEDRFLAAGYIFSEGKRLESLSLKLLELLVMQNQEFEFRPISLPALFLQIRTVFLPIFSGSQTKLVCNAPEGIIQGEADLLITLLLNLLDNARKAISGAGVISLTAEMQADRCIIIVSDTGRGISAQDLPRVTEAFYMADKSRARQEGGAGLGLALCTRIAALHGGSISIQSEQDAGTCVTLTLPREGGV